MSARRRPVRPAGRRGFAPAAPAAVAERLEDRVVLDGSGFVPGNVAADASNGTLRVTGDAVRNSVSVALVAANTYEVRAFEGGTVNGAGDRQTFAGVTRFVVVQTGGGDDSVGVFGLEGGPEFVTEGIYVGTGAGDDRVEFRAVRTRGYLAAITGDGADFVRSGGIGIAGDTVATDWFIFTGAGDDHAQFRGVTARGAFVASLEAGRDRLFTEDSVVGGTYFAYGGAGDDQIVSTRDRINTAGPAGFLYMSGGDGADALGVVASAVAGTTFLDPNAGDDAVRAERGAFGGVFYAYLGAGDDRLELEGNAFAAAAVYSGDAGADTLIEVGNAGGAGGVFRYLFEA